MEQKETKKGWIPVATWQFYNACKVNLRMETLTKLFKISPRQVARWACDPDYTESSQRNPMDRYEVLLKKLMEMGSEDIARAAVDRQARIVGCELKSSCVVPDKGNIQDELLDNLPAMAAYQDAIITKQPIEKIRILKMNLITELEEDLAVIENGGGQGND